MTIEEGLECLRQANLSANVVEFINEMIAGGVGLHQVEIFEGEYLWEYTEPGFTIRHDKRGWHTVVTDPTYLDDELLKAHFPTLDEAIDYVIRLLKPS